MAKIIYILLVFVLFACETPDSKLDKCNTSREFRYLKQAEDPTLSGKEKVRLGRQTYALILAKNENDICTRKALDNVARVFCKFSPDKEYLKVSLLLLHKSAIARDTLFIASSYQHQGRYYSEQLVYDSAYYFLNKSKYLMLKMKDHQKLGELALDIARLQFIIGDYTSSEQSLFESLKYFKEIENKDLQYRNYNLLGIVNCELGDYEKALYFHKKAIILTTDNQIKYFKWRATSLNNIGNVYRYRNDYKNAIKYYSEGLRDVTLQLADPIIYAMLLDNLAYAKEQTGDVKDIYQLFKVSEGLRDTLKLTQGLIVSKVHLAEYFAIKGDTAKAISFAEKSYHLSAENRLPLETLISLQQLIALNTPKTPYYADEYIRINDSIQFAERKIRNKFALIAYETEEIKEEKLTAIKQKWIILVIGVALITSIVLLLIIIKQRGIRKKLLFAQQQHRANDSIYQLINDSQIKEDEGRHIEKKRIAKELHDGVMNRLTSTRLNLFILTKKQDKETIDKCLTFINGIENIEHEIEHVAHDLAIERFSSHNSYSGILQTLFAEHQEISNAKINAEISETVDWSLTSATIKMNLYRILQEALQNSIKYAEAKMIAVEIRLENNALHLKIQDDGTGFNTRKRKSGIGIKNMKTRIKSLSGTIEIFSLRSNGTTIIVNLPLKTT